MEEQPAQEQPVDMKKADKMRLKTEQYRRLFNLPAVDLVLQDYHCGFWRGLPFGWWQGRLLITTNHVLFRATVGDFALDIKLRSIDHIESARSLLVMPTGLDIYSLTEKFSFGTFVTPGHRDEALVLIRHLHRHGVTLITQEEITGEEIDEELLRLSHKNLAPLTTSPAPETHLKLRTAPILHKMSNDSLRFAKLHFGDVTFSVLDGGDDEEQPVAASVKERCEWKYDDIETVCVRSRPLHLDVRFGAKFERLRLCSAEIQSVVIELFHRAPNAKVVFEPGPMAPFLYRLPRASIVPRLVRLREDTLKSFRDSSKALVAVYED